METNTARSHFFKFGSLPRVPSHNPCTSNEIQLLKYEPLTDSFFQSTNYETIKYGPELLPTSPVLRAMRSRQSLTSRIRTASAPAPITTESTKPTNPTKPKVKPVVPPRPRILSSSRITSRSSFTFPRVERTLIDRSPSERISQDAGQFAVNSLGIIGADASLVEVNGSMMQTSTPVNPTRSRRRFLGIKPMRLHPAGHLTDFCHGKMSIETVVDLPEDTGVISTSGDDELSSSFVEDFLEEEPSCITSGLSPVNCSDRSLHQFVTTIDDSSIAPAPSVSEHMQLAIQAPASGDHEDASAVIPSDAPATDESVGCDSSEAISGEATGCEMPDVALPPALPQTERYRCEHCPSTYKQKQSLVRHIKFQHENIAHSCLLCEKRFRDKAELALHQDSVHKQLQFPCDQCDKVFLSKGGLRNHLNEHSGLYKYLCPVCARQFVYKTDYEGHVASHSGDKPYNCTKCDKSFSHAGTLSRHRESCGTTARSLKCSMCPKMFKAARYVREHEQAVHLNPNRYQCPTCGKCFGHRGSLKNHSKKH